MSPFTGRPRIMDTRKSMIKMKKITLAILAAPTAILVNPNMAAIMAMTRKVSDQRSIIIDLGLQIRYQIESG